MCPFGGSPRGSGSTTSVGKSWLRLPSPELIHEPILGNPGSTNPVACMNVAGPCTLDFETIEWMNAMSSTHSPSAATGSLSHLPHLPYWRQPNGEFITLSGADWKSSTASPGSNFSP